MFQYWTEPNPSEIQQLVNEHSTLVELDLVNYRFTADTVIALIRKLDSLRKFRFLMKKSSEYKSICV